MPKIVIIEKGTKYGRLTVIGEAGRRVTAGGNKKRMLICECECGTVKNVDMTSLIHHGTISCGCYRVERSRELSYKHGMASRSNRKTEYALWNNILQRCTNPKSAQWKDYGGRGITVCKEWTESFAAFYAYVGKKPHKSLSLDRIDNDRGYEPDNVRWASRAVQARNKRPYPTVRKSRLQMQRLNREIKWLIENYG
jgi:hypothetical protein